MHFSNGPTAADLAYPAYTPESKSEDPESLPNPEAVDSKPQPPRPGIDRHTHGLLSREYCSCSEEDLAQEASKKHFELQVITRGLPWNSKNTRKRSGF